MLCKYNDSGDEGKKCNKNFVLLTCRVPVPVPRPACVSAPRGWGERGHSAGMEGGGALEGPDSGRSFRDSAGVCGGVMEEQIIFPHTIFCPLRNWMHLEGSKIEERLQIDKTTSDGSASWAHFFLKTPSNLHSYQFDSVVCQGLTRQQCYIVAVGLECIRLFLSVSPWRRI